MKKIISLILCLVLALGMTATVFAATSFDPTQGGTTGTIPNVPMNPAPNAPTFDAVNPPRNSIIVDLTKEENPDTGAPVFLAVPAVTAVICAAAIIGKRK